MHALLFSSLVACVITGEKGGNTNDNSVTDPQNADSDGDGLLDADELELGTDPQKADTDGDGLNDPDEIAAGSNPNFFYSHPIAEGGYLMGACPVVPDEANAGPTGKGGFDYGGEHYEWDAYQKGDVMANWGGVDHFDQEISFYNFCGNYTLVTVSAMWCGPCQQMASTAFDEQEEVRKTVPNFQTIDLLWQNLAGDDVPSSRDLSKWEGQFGLTGIPVVAPGDVQDPALNALDVDGYIPTTILLSPTMEVISMDESVSSAAALTTAIARWEKSN